jgi:excisionase family DNA binding protein
MPTATLKPNDVFLTPAEAADLLKISDRSLREFRKRGTIRAVRLGERTIRYPRAEIERLAAAGCGDGPNGER